MFRKGHLSLLITPCAAEYRYVVVVGSDGCTVDDKKQFVGRRRSQPDHQTLSSAASDVVRRPGNGLEDLRRYSNIRRKGSTFRSSPGCKPLWCVYTVQQTSSKLPANVMLDVCWKFAGSCKHSITHGEPSGKLLLTIGCYGFAA